MTLRVYNGPSKSYYITQDWRIYKVRKVKRQQRQNANKDKTATKTKRQQRQNINKDKTATNAILEYKMNLTNEDSSHKNFW